jgi:hypothetical protein
MRGHRPRLQLSGHYLDLESTDEMPHGIDNDGNGDYETNRNPDYGANQTQ